MLEVRYIYDVEGKPVNEYTLRNGKYRLSVMNLGATITKVIVPNQYERLENITLRYYNYKDYIENQYYLGCLIDYDKFIQNQSSQLNYYFECTVLENTLKFTYEKEKRFIIIKFSLVENQVLIEYDTNLAINLAHVLFFNLSGNVKEDVTSHDIMIDSTPISITDIPFFQMYKERNSLTLDFKDNGIHLDITSNNRDILLSFGKYFNNEFYINKKQCADNLSGIGVVFGGKKSKYVSYEFGNQ